MHRGPEERLEVFARDRLGHGRIGPQIAPFGQDGLTRFRRDYKSVVRGYEVCSLGEGVKRLVVHFSEFIDYERFNTDAISASSEGMNLECQNRTIETELVRERGTKRLSYNCSPGVARNESLSIT